MIDQRWIVILVLVSILAAACGHVEYISDNPRIILVASTSIVGDIVQQVGGENIDLIVLIPYGVDPHTFEPRPQDLAAISDAQVIFINGFGLEEALEPIIRSNRKGDLIAVSDGIQALKLNGSVDATPGEVNSANDPHTWMDPENVIHWTEKIADALENVDPENAEIYRQNADNTIAGLNDLDKWIREQITQIPQERRKLISDHATFGYFANRYGFEIPGHLLDSFSTNASYSAREISILQDKIRQESVPAIFISTSADPKLAEQLGRDLGIKIIRIYSGTLSMPGGEADTYLKYMRYNVSQIVGALK